MSTHEGESEHIAVSRRILVGIVVVLVLLGIFLVALDWRKAQHVLKQANWHWVGVALLFTAVSYVCLSYGFAVACRIFGITLRQRDLLEVGFISNVLNNLLSAGGAAGHSVRLIVMQRRGSAPADILAASLFHTYFNTLMLLILFPIGLGYLLVSHTLKGGAVIGVAMIGALAVLLAVLATAVVFSRPTRARIFRGLRRVVRAITRRDIGPSLEEFDNTVTRGVAAIRSHPVLLGRMLGLVFTDWFSSMVALECCFEALGYRLSPGVLVTGFAIGVTAGLVSMVPGGLGVQDGSMAGIYHLLGVPLEHAVLAAVLFRVVYYFIPFGVSLASYWRLLRTTREVT
ncbi:MAG TPA: flippase-like domain-containing protein [Aggregatilineaceae bacterium]|nr:flippase-like domain-containing protein [Aggregatilineaceae bacterium]